MNLKEFINFYDEQNKTQTDIDDMTEIEYYPWKNKITFLREFTEVFDIPMWYLYVDDNIWFITDEETFYCNKEFLDFCIENKIKWNLAYDLYHNNLEAHTNNKEETYKQTLDRITSKDWKLMEEVKKDYPWFYLLNDRDTILKTISSLRLRGYIN